MSEKERALLARKMWEYAKAYKKEQPLLSVVSIRKNRLFVKTFADKTNARLAGLLVPLKKTLNCFDLPNVDLYIDSSDECGVDVPLLAWNKRRGERCILYPWSQFMTPALYFQGPKPAWKSRKAIAVFRGSTTNGDKGTPCEVGVWKRVPRIKVVEFCRNHTDLCDAQLTNVVQCNDVAKKEIIESLGISRPLSWEEEMTYRHVLLLDGNGAAASRSLKAFTGGFTVLKQETDFLEFFYSALRPWKHYVPLAKDLSDLEERLRWVQGHPEEAEAIANNAATFSARYINDFATTCYLAELVRRYHAAFPTPTLIPADIVKTFTPYKEIVPRGVKEYVNGAIDDAFKLRCGKFM
jgi:hypothetical protein